MFIKPMLAAPLKDWEPIGQWFFEEKYDGHRLIVEVDPKGGSLFSEPKVTAWSRNEKIRNLPSNVVQALALLPEGVYDGELHVPGAKSYGVTELTNSERLVYTVFDILYLGTHSLMTASYKDRRTMLRRVFDGRVQKFVRLAPSTPVSSREEAMSLCQKVWDEMGEGGILKAEDSLYEEGKRSKKWRKMKSLQSDALEVIGFQEAKLGPCAIVILRDRAGNETKVKALNDEERARLEADPDSFIGRELRIEFQERTEEGSYRHPRWDRWENE